MYILMMMDIFYLHNQVDSSYRQFTELAWNLCYQKQYSDTFILSTTTRLSRFFLLAIVQEVSQRWLRASKNETADIYRLTSYFFFSIYRVHILLIKHVQKKTMKQKSKSTIVLLFTINLCKFSCFSLLFFNHINQWIRTNIRSKTIRETKENKKYLNSHQICRICILSFWFKYFSTCWTHFIFRFKPTINTISTKTMQTCCCYHCSIE